MEEIDLEILRAVQDGIPHCKEPFAEVSKRLDIGEDELIEQLTKLKEVGVIRRFGASINQRKVGIKANAVVVWKVSQKNIAQAAKIMSDCVEISHCYERQTIPGIWEYNLFTVTHGSDRESVERFIKKLSERVEISDYLILFSKRRFKATSTGRVR